MNANYIARALCYHGQPMQKIWEDERSVEDLRNMGLIQPNYSVYQERQKFFTFQERAKRLKMHQFLARKAIDLYDRHLVANVMEDSLLAQAQDYVVPLAPFEYFLNVKDKGDGGRYRMSALKPGDIICAAVQKIVGSARIVVKPLCTAEPLHFYLADIPIKAALIGSTRNFAPNDFLRCEILEVSADAERLTLGTAPGNQSNATDIKLGLCELTDFPKYYRQIHSLGLGHTPHYEEQLLESLEFQNPNYDVLFQMNGIQPNSSLTLISYLKAGFPEQDYAAELRQKQASQWAFR
ncbi:tetratricopeptide repeat protein 14 homolog isoform X2 [Scaptodrosophila lebanonensis]|nr:tetratricopeptide repeat protein 14 homolog isoform X2 [Scaptodrosophila lebanonensis]